MTIEIDLEKARAIKDAIGSRLALAPLAAQDQNVVDLDQYEPEWIDVPFKRPIKIYWDWNTLLLPATARIKDPRLAIIGATMSWCCELSSLVAESLFDTLGFEHVWSSHYRLSTLARNAVSEPARTFAHKAVVKDGQTYHIVCATFKGTTTTDDAITDVKSVGDGFLEAGENCAAALAEYVRGIEGATDTNTVLFICGHSLGAAVANVVGRLTRGIAEDDMRFVYTCASPNYECGDDATSGYAFPNFRTFTNVDDAVPTVPPTYTKIGIEYTYDIKALDADQRARFDAAYHYFRGVPFDQDSDPIGLGITRIDDPALAEVLKNHLLATYMSLIISELSDDQMKFGVEEEEEYEVTE